jgi:hypothetical protein
VQGLKGYQEWHYGWPDRVPLARSQEDRRPLTPRASAEEELLFGLEGLLEAVAQPGVGQLGEQIIAIFYSASKERMIYLLREHVAGWCLSGPGILSRFFLGRLTCIR